MTTFGAIHERPIIFSAPMVRAILDGRKTQTRRVIRQQPSEEWLPKVERYHPAVIDRDGYEQPGAEVFGAADENEGRVCPFGGPGDRLWVREAAYIAPVGFGDGGENCTDDSGRRRIVGYVASMEGDSERCAREYGVKKRPSIHMPRWASRITLEVVRVRVERVQEISVADAVAEGADLVAFPEPQPMGRERVAFASLWDSINYKRGHGWAANPWVWVVEFKRIETKGAPQS